MQLNEIVQRISDCIPHVDRTTRIQNTNRRTKVPYLKGAKSLTEPQLVKAVVHHWRRLYPTELPGFTPRHLRWPYPLAPDNECDLVIGPQGTNPNLFEWAIEVKHIALVGDNGNNNDYGLQKLVSPYLKDRSLFHDAYRLSNASFARRRAVIAYGFDYDSDAIDFAEARCNALKIGDKVWKNLRRVLRSVDSADPKYRLDELLEIGDVILRHHGLVSRPFVSSRFSGLTRHPCGSAGIIMGWEVDQASAGISFT